jgi:uncharacterized protein YbjT (DUF2867 family)
MNDSKPILITGATGRVGGRVVSELLEAGAKVRAMTRTPEAANMPPGVNVVRGDLTIPESLDECLDGVDTTFLFGQLMAVRLPMRWRRSLVTDAVWFSYPLPIGRRTPSFNSPIRWP